MYQDLQDDAYKSLVGIDEAGRGPIAGPVCVGAVYIAKPVSREVQELLLRARDSKLMAERAREALYDALSAARAACVLDFAAAFTTAPVLDRVGVTQAVQAALSRALHRLDPDSKETHIMLDGLLHAPAHFESQQTIIKGDRDVPIISLASIVAKVTRDRHMRRLARKYPGYGFERHKGYGTKQHYTAIEKYGATPLHRQTYLHDA